MKNTGLFKGLIPICNTNIHLDNLNKESENTNNKNKMPNGALHERYKEKQRGGYMRLIIGIVGGGLLGGAIAGNNGAIVGAIIGFILVIIFK